MVAGHGSDLERPAPRLSDFLREHQTEIMDDWAQRMRTVSPARELSESALLDHLPAILKRIADSLAVIQAGGQASLGGLPKQHAVDRLSHGFDLDQIVTEYSLLRRAIFGIWSSRVGPTIDVAELRNLDQALDESVTLATLRYAESRERLLRALDRISQAAFGPEGLHSFLKALLRATIDNTESVDTAVVLLREDQTLRVVAAVGLEEALEETFSLQIPEGLAGHVALTKEPILIRDAASDPRVLSPAIRKKGVRVLYGVPLIRGGEVLGVAHIGSLTAAEFSEEDKLLFRTMVSRATSVVIKSQLIAELQRTEEAQRFLARTSHEIARSLDYRATLDKVARLAVPSIADWCVVDVMEDGELRRVSVAHVDPEQEHAVREWSAQYEANPKAEAPIREVMRTGKPSLHTHIEDADLTAASPDDGYLAMLRSLGLVSSIMVPIVSRDRAVGAIAFATSVSGRHYNEHDVATAEDFADRVATAMDNSRLYAESQQAVESRDQVLGIVSHDLRNHLAIISMAGQALGMQARSLGERPEVARSVEMIDRTTRTMQRLISDLLDMAALQAGRMSMERQPIPIAALLAEAEQSYGPIAQAKGITFRLEGDAGAAEVIGDRVRLHQVLSNLLGNAIKFCDSGDSVTLRVQARETDVLIAVADNGPGIPADHLDKIFERYRTVERQQRSGTGLGLHIAKRIIERHAGRIWVESEVGTGTTFLFTLPRSPGTPAPAEP